VSRDWQLFVDDIIDHSERIGRLLQRHTFESLLPALNSRQAFRRTDASRSWECASAGGLDALLTLFQSMPADTGMGFVVTQHLDAGHHSLLADLLSKFTAMRVVQVGNGISLEPDRICVIPPNTYMTVRDGVLLLKPPSDALGIRKPIDRFLFSLAGDQRDRGIGTCSSPSTGPGLHKPAAECGQIHAVRRLHSGYCETVGTRGGGAGELGLARFRPMRRKRRKSPRQGSSAPFSLSPQTKRRHDW